MTDAETAPKAATPVADLAAIASKMAETRCKWTGEPLPHPTRAAQMLIAAFVEVAPHRDISPVLRAWLALDRTYADDHAGLKAAHYALRDALADACDAHDELGFAEGERAETAPAGVPHYRTHHVYGGVAW